MCVVSGRHMIRSEWVFCPASGFPAIRSEYISYLKSTSEATQASLEASASSKAAVSIEAPMARPKTAMRKNPSESKQISPTDGLSASALKLQTLTGFDPIFSKPVRASDLSLAPASEIDAYLASYTGNVQAKEVKVNLEDGEVLQEEKIERPKEHSKPTAVW